MVSTGSDLTLKLLEAQNGNPNPEPKDFEVLQRELIEIKGELKSHSGSVLCFALSSDDHSLLSGSTDKSIIIWDLTDLKLVQTLKSHSADVLSLSFNQENSMFLSSSSDTTLKLWDFASRSLIRTFTGHSEKVNSALFLGSDQIFSCSDDKLIKQWTIEGILIQNIEMPSAVNSIQISNDLKYLISGCSDKSLRLFETSDKKNLKILEIFNESVTCLDIDQVFLASSAGVSIKVWNQEDWTLKCHLTDSRGVKSLKLADDSKLLLTCSDAFYMTIWDLSLEKKVYGLTYYPNTTLAVCATSDLQKIITGLSDKTIKVFNTVSRKDYCTLFGHQSEVNMIKVSSCGDYLVSASSDSTLKVWDIEKKNQVITFGLPEVLCIALALKNNIVAGYSDSLIRIWNTDKAELLETLSFHQKEVTCIASDLKNELAASASADFQVKIWSFSSREVVLSLNYHREKITSLLFVNSFLMSSSNDKTLVIWDTLRMENFNVVKEFLFPVVDTCKSKNEIFFAACSLGGEVEVWEAASRVSQFRKKFSDYLNAVKVLESKKWVLVATQCRSIIITNFTTGSEVSVIKTATMIYSIEISYDDAYLLAGMQDSKILSFDLQTKKCCNIFEGHSGTIHSLVLSTNPKHFFSASKDKSIRLWILSSKSQLKTVNTIYGKIFCFSLTKDKKTIITGHEFGEVRFFNVNSKQEDSCDKAHTKDIKCLELSPDDSNFVTGSSDGEIKLWSTSSKKLVVSFPETGVVSSLAFTDDSLFLISANNDKIKMWSITFKRIEHQFLGHTGIINQIKVVGGRIFSVSADKSIKIWSLTNKKIENTFQNIVYAANCIDIHPSQKLAVWNDYNKIHIFNLEDSHRVLTLEGHLREVIKSVLFSPNGKYVISASADSSIKLWNIKNMCERAKFVGVNSSVLAICTDAEKRLIIAGTEDGWLIVWNTSGGLLMKFQEHQEAIRALAFSDKYQLIASAGKDKSIKIWNFQMRIFLKSLQGHGDLVKALVFLDDILISASWDKTIKIWDFHSGNLINELLGHTSSVCSLVIADPITLISCSFDKTIKFWDLSKMEEKFSLPGSKSPISSLAFNPSSSHLASGCQDSSITIWDLSSRKPQKTLPGHSKEISCLTFIKSGEFLVSASYDRTFKLWNVHDFTLKASCIAASFNIFGAIELCSDSLLIAASDKSLTLWDIETCRQKTVMLWPSATAYVIRRFHDFFYIGMSNGSVCVYDALTNKFCKYFVVSNTFISDLRVHSNGTVMVAGGGDKNFIVFDLEKNFSCDLPGHTNSISAVEVTQDLNIGISGGLDSSIKIWDISGLPSESPQWKDKERLKFTLSGHRRAIQSLLLFSQNNWIISTSFDKTIKIWDIAERSELKVMKNHKGPVICSALIRNETLLATGSEDSSIKIWDFLYGNENFFLFGHTGKVVAICESEDQERLISGGDDCLVKIWDLKEKCVEFSFRAHSDSITSLAIMGNNYLLTGSADQALKLWDFKNYYTSNRTLNTILKNVERENWSIKNTFDPYCQDKLVFYNIYENIRSDEYSFLSKTVSQVSFTQYKFTILHVLCFNGRDDIIENLLTQPTLIRPDRFSRSPIYYAIIKKHQNCADLILNYLCKSIEESKQLECFSSIYSLRHDFTMIISNSSVHLKDFLNVMIQTSPVFFSKLSVSLPRIQFSSTFLPSLNETPSLLNEEQKDEEHLEEIPIQFDFSLFELPSQVGSSEVINLLNSILECSDSQIFETEIIQNYIQFQWNRVKYWTIGYSLLLFVNIALILVLIDESGPDGDKNSDNWFYVSIFVLINILLVAWEGIQIAIQKFEYFTDTWNIFDMLRILSTFTWIIFSISWRPLLWLVIFTNFLRGLTAFRLFDGTRYYVRLILRSVSDTKFFVIMLSYAIITFGSMVMVSDGKAISVTFETLWMTPYKLNFGSYDMTEEAPALLKAVYIIATMINVIVMLNLLVSILGDSHDQFQVEKNIIDYKEKAILSLEIQQMMFWNREINSNFFMHVMKSFASGGMQESWEGRMIYMEKKIEKVTQVFSENQNRFGEKINEKIIETQQFIEEKILPVQENLVKIMNSPAGNENVLEILKLTQTDFDLKIDALGRKVDCSHNEINQKVMELDGKISGIQSGIDRIMTFLASNN